LAGPQPSPLLAVFDFDGTLVDSQHRIVSAMQAAFAAEGVGRPKPAAVRRIIGLPLETGIRQLAPGVGGLALERLVAGYREQSFGRGSSGDIEPMMPGALAALDALEADDFLLAIATGKSRRGLMRVLEGHGLLGRFVALQTADDAPGKPDPTMLRQAIAEAGAEADHAVMIGDTVFDLQMAANAGVRSIAVAWGYHEVPMLRSAKPDAVIDRFDQLPGTARRLLSRGA
jgi:phosphoglycolate phosphatase